MNIEDLAKDGEKGKPLKKKGYDDVEISDISGGDSAKEGKEKKKGDKKAKSSDDKKDGDNRKEDKDKGASPSKTKKLSGEGKDGEKEKEVEKGEKKDGDGAKSAERGPKAEKSGESMHKAPTERKRTFFPVNKEEMEPLMLFAHLLRRCTAALIGGFVKGMSMNVVAA
ncbi:unnamed protein product [Angiostrongylus costaricensis]|uniref:High mobility group nucleosome-binding domain-containing protein 5 n=1 Tax=Angiostrongylus costaricensis TaxID=334426 RepID=A0A158PEI3_ANGCS|nr:unnamed protein product [Angiostrongylus costaricensis]